MVQMLLLGICVSLFLPPGDALTCRLCMSPSEGSPCRPFSATCSAKPKTQVCHAYTVTKDGKVQQKILGCKPKKSVVCNTSTNTDGTEARHICCDDRDFCNEDL
ncbi:Hypothetical predicted protein [Podarcis lilfordi]|uniref:UPAR/Ly6 domain-containing protein n=1 Tax=Podarcis lilfordi TaxID=74358 RepID=A0AA35K3Y9_9SAUR|nr:Hypothetical predicted protein [Podarcis lilfordi]